MPIPDYQSCMLPFMNFLSDGNDHTLREAEEALADHFNLTPSERAGLSEASVNRRARHRHRTNRH
ncbi:MAG: restriction endonuclease, partial [Gammaproteobacteria bacterium]|nr:restriction endonuclease [Gammaproteobacteria bacterium]